MKIISLNCWGGKLYKPLAKFIEKQAKDTDVFCFQEMVFGGPDRLLGRFRLRGRLFEKICKILKGYRAYAVPAQRKAIFGSGKKKLPGGAKLGLAVFVKKTTEVLETGSFLSYPIKIDPFKEKVRGIFTGNCQHLVLKSGKKRALLVNVHGIWQWGKEDTPQRLAQSRKILGLIKKKGLPAVVIGDFNLAPYTKSIALLAKDLRHLVSECKIKTTRNRLYGDMEKYKDYIADYAFVSPKILLNRFGVLPDEASDHLPLFLGIEINGK